MKRLTILTILFALLTANAFAQNKQFLYIEFSPADAILEINGEVQETEDGTFQKLLPFGKYNYKLSKEGYTNIDAVIDIAEPNETQYLELKLKKPIGHLSITCDHCQDITGAEVYIDDNLIGTLPLGDYSIASGVYSITIIHPLYRVYKNSIIISDEATTTLEPIMLENNIEAQLVTSESAYIYANGECLGQGSWKGKLPMYQHITFESREDGHESGKLSYILSPKDNGQTIEIPAPIPSYGSLVITSKPAKVPIYIDGYYVGVTPRYISNALSCPHKVEVRNDTIHSAQIVIVEKGKEHNVHFILAKEKAEEKTDKIEVIEESVEEVVPEVQEIVEEVVEDEAIAFQLVDEKPSFQEGDVNHFSKWVNQRLVYPKVAWNNGIQGRVVLQFTIEKDGSVTNVKVLLGVDPLLDKEAVRVVSSSPRWTPGKQKGRAAPVTCTFPVIFQIR